MRVVFLTNQASYHQMQFARAMAAELGEDCFRIVFQKDTSAARAEMGWKDDYQEPYILRFFDEGQRSLVHDWIDQADVVIQGRFPIKYVRKRINQGKLTFACQERLWKKPPSFLRILSRLPHLFKNYYSVNKQNYHFLAIGQCAAADLNKLGVFKERSWVYGYFIDMLPTSVRQESSELKLLWCARMSVVKQPHNALNILEALRAKGVKAKLSMIGDGELRADVESAIQQKGIQEHVSLLGWRSQEEVFDAMRAADVFLMTSHHGEGWGLVVNEALTLGCAVMANQELGSAPCLIDHGRNGWLYKDNQIGDVVAELSTLTLQQIRAIGINAHSTMTEAWSAEVAAKRTLALSKYLLDGRIKQAKKLYSHGPCAFINS